jgi:plasmid stabilization system protein ParE
MPQGDKSKYTEKQQRQAEHIEQSAEQRGLSPERAEEMAWATVNKQWGGGAKGGSGHKPTEKAKSETAKEAATSRKTGTTSVERKNK